MRNAALITMLTALSVLNPAAAQESTAPAVTPGADRVQLAQSGRSCKAASTCEEAVAMWCGGYSRADADGDGIPCENVCRSLQQVEAIKKRIGC